MRVLRRGMSGSDVRQWQEFLTRKGFGAGSADGSFGDRTVQATMEFQRQNGLGADGVAGPGTINKAKEQGFVEAEDAGGGGGGGGSSTGGSSGGSSGGGLSEQALAQIMPNLKADKRAAFFPFLVSAMNEFDINTPARQAAFLAQLAHESAEFRFMEEIWGPTPAQRRYEGRRDLGNTQTGDGFRYKGRGPIQITGRFNYKKYGDLLGVDLIGNPQSAATPEIGFRIAGAYWDKNNINAMADRQDIVAVTRAINGGTNGLDDRKKYYDRAKRVLGVSGGTRGVPSATRGVEEESGISFTRGLDESGEPVPTAAERSASESEAAAGTRGIGVSGGTRSAGASEADAASGASKGGGQAAPQKAAKGGAKKSAKKSAGKGAAKKSGAQKAAKKAAKKSAVKKSSAKKSAKKSAAKKSSAKKSTAKKTSAKKSSAKKSASKKSAKKGSKPGASKKSSGKKSASKKGGRRGNR